MSEKKQTKKRTGVWDEIETLQDPDSGIAVVITERSRGAHAYSFQIVHFDGVGRGNKFVPIPCRGAKHDLEHIVYSLVKRACEIVDAKIKEIESGPPKKKDERRESKPNKDEKRDSKPKPRGGLSQLAREDAERGGHHHTGPTARRKQKKQAKK